MIAVALFVAPAAFANTFTVTSAADTDHGGCATDCTLRDAIKAANALPGVDTITFDIGVGGSFTLLPLGVLPTITQGVSLDATTQPGYAGAPLIAIDNVFLPPSADGLTVGGTGSTVRGLAITRFNHGIVLNGGGQNTVAGNYLGYDGGAAGNAIGLGAYSPSNVIGGPNAGDANVISGNSGSGIDIASAGGNKVLGDLVGTDPSGTSAVPNGTGITVASNSNTIGTAANGRPNVISGNSGDGVFLADSSNNLVDANYLGTDVYGTSALPNGGAGLHFKGGATLATGNEGSSNLISGNGGAGVLIDTPNPDNAQGLDFTQNLIGTDASGQAALGNAGPGLLIAAGDGVGKHSIRQNTIAYNAKGIVVGANSRQNDFFQNLIHDNAGPGIDLNDDGPTPNDPNDADSGANDLINTPVLTSVVKHADGSIEVSGTYDGVPTSGLTYRVEFFSSKGCNANGSTGATTFLGTTDLTSDGNGDFTFDLFYNGSNGVSPPGSFITATASDQTQQDETSEFSACKKALTPDGTTFTVTTTADTGAGSLHDAIDAANANPGTDTIAFSIPDPPFVIRPTDASQLPAITDPVVIDGTTQPGFAGTPLIQLDGTLTSAQTTGLDVAAGVDPSTIRGLSITGFSRAGIRLEGAPSLVEGNYIGITPTGTSVANGSGGFSDGGIVVSSGANVIGGTTAASRNVISGNKGQGIQFGNESGNVVIGNRIGTDPSGTTAIANTAAGIRFEDVSFQRVGGTVAGEGNLISGNGEDGIFLNSGYQFDTARIEGNVIGLAADGKTALPNGGAGINAQAVANIHIGGAVAGAGNVISGNGGAGLNVAHSSGAVVQGNLIGTSADGSTVVANGSTQVVVDTSDDVLIGGTTAKARNVVSSGFSNGITLTSGDGDTVSGNYVGTDASGQNALGNFEGIVVGTGSTNATIGGATPGAGNVISASNGNGLRVAGGTGDGIRIVGNSIGTNAGETTTLGNDVGIELDNTTNVQVGSTSPSAGNVIAGSDDTGIIVFLGATQNKIAGNYIGTDRADSLDLGNGTGIRLVNGDANNNLIGPSNVIAHSGNYGIEMDNGAGNRFSANSIHDNGAEGIHLAGGGANNDQTSPTITTATFAGSTTTVAGKLASAPTTTYFVEYFSTPSCSGQPQGQTYLGFKTVTTDSGGNAFFNFQSTLPGVGDAITATATNASTLDTSQFSACASVTNGYVVNTADDHADINGCTAADCSLREAIGAADAAAAPLASITFAIPGGGPQQINVTEAPLPDITTPVVIDGTTESGVPAGTAGITINGAFAGGSADGLVLAPGSDGSTLTGLDVQAFTAANYPASAMSGIKVESDDNTLERLSVGTSADGLTAQPNDFGIVVTGSGNTIGAPGAGNIVSGNRSYGIHIDGTLSGAHNNVVAANLVGTDSTGNTALPNDTGIAADNAPNTMIGGLGASSGNVVYGAGIGIDVNGTLGSPDATQIRFNNVGIGLDGVTALGQSYAWAVGVARAAGSTVADNAIGNGESGLAVADSNNTIVIRNAVGTDRLGLTDQSNTYEGIYVQQVSAPTHPTGIVIGSADNGNIVKNNPLEGIKLENVDQTTVVDNEVDGNGAAGAAGINIKGSGNTIGPGNTIVHNGDSFTGIDVTSGVGNTITQNSIDNNVGLGIDLNVDGVTANDPAPDADTGPNNLQNFPVLASASLISNGSVRIKGALMSAPNRTYRIEYFSSPVCDPSGNGEGANFLGFSLLGTDSAGTLTIDTGTGLTAPVTAGEAITATATDQTTGDTSEFSSCVTAADAPQSSPFVVNTNADHDDGACTAGDCTLREAMSAANAAPGSAIHFDLPAGQTTIAPASALPFVNAATTIDASTQAGYSGTPLVTLDGSNPTSGGIGFDVSTNGSTIRGFVITNWVTAGIDLSFSNGNTIAGNYIGINVGGVNAQNGDGIWFDQNSDNNTIGGTGPNDRNVISGNGSYGIELANGEGGAPDNNTIVGNYIGLRPDGTGTAGVSGNVSGGIFLTGDGNTIGGSTAAARNYISANDDVGLRIFGSGNIVKGNWVGLDKNGNPVANSGYGISSTPLATDVANVIGGLGPGDGNVISGNFDSGVFLQSPSTAAPPGTIVRGNLIGTDPTGTTAIANGGHGIETEDGGFNQIDHNTISGNSGAGIYMTGFDSNRNVITQNMIGTNAAGTAALGNGADGIQFDDSSGTVRNNVISGNVGAGVEIDAPESDLGLFTTVAGNKIGTNAAGTAAIPNAQGIVDHGGVQDVIGGANPGDGNLISGNTNEGVVINGFANFVTLEGNVIGLNTAGNAAVPNATGIAASGGTDTLMIGGSTAGARNVISGNTGTGISLVGVGGDGGISVFGNYIGTDSTGTQPIGNSVGIDSNNSNGVTIGDSGSASGNVVSGNTGYGVHIEGDGSSNVVDGNSIGVTTAGGSSGNLGNGDDGVHVGPLIHDTVVSKNTIEHNKGAGVAVSEPSTHTIVTQNSIDANTGLGIDLGPGGVTPNDGASEADGFQNFPLLTSVSTTTVSGTLSSTASLTYNVELFLTPTCDPSGNGEGLQYLTTTQVSTNAGGAGSFTVTVPPLPAGEFVTATAQNLDGGTSEFSACLSTVPPPIATNLTLTPSSGTTPAGAARVQLSNVPPSVFLQPQSTSQTAPVNDTPVNDTPVNDTPVNDLPVNDLPVNDLPVNDIGFDSLSLSLPALGDTALSSIPLLRPGGWAKVLSDAPGTPLAGLPLQSVTLRDYYRLGTLVPDKNPETRATNRIAPITLAGLDLTHSPLGSLPSSAIVLANVKLSWLRPLSTWCQLFGPTYCTTLNTSSPGSDLTNTSVMAAAIQGAPVNDTPVNDTPVNDLPVNDVPTGQTPVNEAPVNDLPVNDTPVNDLPVNDTPVNDVPVNDLPVNDTPVNDLPVNDIMAANTTLGHTPVNDLPVNDLAAANTVIVCIEQNPTAPHAVPCTNPSLTLKQAYDGGAIRPGVTLKDLRNAAGPSPNVFDGISIGDLHYWGTITIKQLVDSLARGTMTLGDYFLLVLRSPTASQGLAWENLNLAGGIAQYSTNGSTVDYNAHFTVQPNGGPSNVPSPLTVKVTLGSGFLYKPGTSHLTQDPAVCSATSPSIPDPGVTPLPNGGIELKWGITANVGSSYSICFTSRPGIDLGPEASSIDATPAGGATHAANGGTVEVGDTSEPNNNADATAPELMNDSFYLSYLTSTDDVDYYRFKAPAAGSIVTFHLSHLPADYDLVVYGPPETPLRPSIAGTMPLDEPPVTDSGAGLTHQTDSLPSQSLDDLLLQPNMPVVGVSASRGTDPEDIVAVSPGSGYYTVQVTGYNGATSPNPYMIRVATRAPRTVSPVPPRTITGTAGPALPTTLPTGLNTVFLVNRKQLEGIYGSTGATNVMNAISNDSARFTSLGFPNVTLSVDNATNDTGGAVAAAYTQWNATPGDPAAANRVVQAINAMVDNKIRSQPNGSGLKYLVIVGGDRIIPFARLDDFTITSANESNYADTFAQGTDLFSSLNLSQMLSDDPYASTAPVPYLTRQLYVPNLSVGRLVETPDDIVRTLNNFVSTTVNGVLTPTTALTTGYDFLYDSSTTINGYLRSRLPTTAGSLLDNPAVRGDTWTLTQLVGAFAPTTGTPPSITSLNGHASHYQFQAPTDDAGVRGGILTTAALPTGVSSYSNRLVFSMGCHAGLSVADATVLAAGASTLDWPQAFAQRGAGSFLGNTGYGYGDTLVTAYSEELNRLFAQNIAAGAKVGNALVAAKQAYFAELGVFGVYDEKAMAEFTLYGLPMWGVANASGGTGATAALAADTSAPQQAAATTQAPSAPTPSTTTNGVITDPATGLSAETFSVSPTPTPTPTPPPPGVQPQINVPTYWTDPTDGVQVTHLRPIEPKKLVGLSGTSAHGALITELTSNDLRCVTPAFDRPVFDSSANEPALTFADLAFPSKIQTVRTYETPQGRKQQLVLVTGQYYSQSCNSDPTPPVGVQRLFSKIGGRVFNSSSTDFAAPVYKRIQAVQIGSNAAFNVDVTGNQPASDSVKQVVVAVLSGSSSNWTFVNLTQSSPGSTHWTGGTPVSGTNTFQYFVQAVDGNGNVAVSTNKGFYFSGAMAPPPPTGGINAGFNGPQVNGWYTQGAGLTIAPIPGVVFDVSIDGGPFNRYDPQHPPTIGTDGVHRIDIRASNGGTATLYVPVDATAPEIVVNSPANGGQYVLNSSVQADYFCRDSGSGVVTPCTGTLPNGANIDTSTVGQHTFTVGAITDAAGHTTPARTVTYTVGYRKILFSSQRTGDGDIYAMNADGSGVTRLTTTAGLDEQPVWSPDGSKIAFASARNATKMSGLDIYVMDAGGGNVTRLTTANGDDTAPSWSPDGRKIAFQSTRDGNLEIYTMNADGTAQTRLTNTPNIDSEPAWSPDGLKIAFVSDRNIGLNVWTMNPNGSGVLQLTSTKQAEVDPTWSPDSKKIVLSSNRAGGSGYDLWSIAASNGSSPVQLTSANGDDNDPVFSRDGLKIAFTSNRASATNPDIYVANANGSGATRLTTTSGFDRQPDW